MSIRAGRYNTKLHKYEDVLLPDECRTYEEDMEKNGAMCTMWQITQIWRDVHLKRSTYCIWIWICGLCRMLRWRNGQISKRA